MSTIRVGRVQILQYSISGRTVAAVYSAHPTPTASAAGGWTRSCNEGTRLATHANLDEQRRRREQQTRRCYWSSFLYTFDVRMRASRPSKYHSIHQSTRKCYPTQPYMYIEPESGRASWPSRTGTSNILRSLSLQITLRLCRC